MRPVLPRRPLVPSHALVACLAAAATLLAPAALHAQRRSLDLTIDDVGLSIGDSREVTGVRLNFRDTRLRRVAGINATVWAPEGEPMGKVTGIALGLPVTASRDISGLGVGIGGVGAGRHLRGIMLGGAGVGAGDDVTGIALGGLGVGAGGELRGIMV